MGHLTTYLDIESCKILRSGFDFTSNLTSAIGDLANRGFLASYVSRHTAMAYDILRQKWPRPQKNRQLNTRLSHIRADNLAHPKELSKRSEDQAFYRHKEPCNMPCQSWDSTSRTRL